MYPIELKGISKVYHPGQRWARTALHDIHLCIAEGEACALMGASGSLRPLPANAASMA